MAFEEALVARLIAAPGIAALAGDRISWFGRGRGGGSELTLFEVSPGEDWTHDGAMSLAEARVQIDAWSADPDEAMALARAVRAAMQAETTIAGWRFEPASLEARQASDAGEQDGGDPLFRVRQDFVFFHEPE